MEFAIPIKPPFDFNLHLLLSRAHRGSLEQPSLFLGRMARAGRDPASQLNSDASRASDSTTEQLNLAESVGDPFSTR